jgi:hypothetical protein
VQPISAVKGKVEAVLTLDTSSLDSFHTQLLGGLGKLEGVSHMLLFVLSWPES